MTKIDAETALMLVHTQKALAGDVSSAKLVLDEARHRGNVIVGKSAEEIAADAVELAKKEKTSLRIIEMLEDLAEKRFYESLDSSDPLRIAREARADAKRSAGEEALSARSVRLLE